jgi:hypothetical protein
MNVKVNLPRLWLLRKLPADVTRIDVANEQQPDLKDRLILNDFNEALTFLSSYLP